DGSPTEKVRRWLDEGITVAGLDLLFQGESSPDGQPLTRTRRVKNPRESAAYTFGYNHTVCQQRIHDLLTAIRFVQSHENAPSKIRLVAGPGAGHWAACARAVSGNAVTECEIDVGDFRFIGVNDIHDPDFIPGGAKFLDAYALKR
ncbi:MAG: hypothetical protein L6Q38_19005, partial [Nitrospira sp.]|nr:hypothetical protein [Nitrospira sp.]